VGHGPRHLHDLFAVSDRSIVLRRGEEAEERRVADTGGDEIVRLMVRDEYRARTRAFAGVDYSTWLTQ
jgi:ABC-type sugar transport system ATPase subunit